jgi:hypothetical protein
MIKPDQSYNIESFMEINPHCAYCARYSYNRNTKQVRKQKFAW